MTHRLGRGLTGCHGDSPPLPEALSFHRAAWFLSVVDRPVHNRKDIDLHAANLGSIPGFP